MSRRPDFDELVGSDVPAEERDRLRRVHDLLVQSDPPPELSPGLESVPWPEEALGPLFGRRRPERRRHPVMLAFAVLSALALGYVFGQATSSSNPTSLNAVRSIALVGTKLNPTAHGTLALGAQDKQGNWPMVLRASGLQELPEGGYYDLYLTRHGKPLVLCGTFNANGGAVAVRLSVAYELRRFDGWVVTRQLPGHFEPTDIVLKPAPSRA